MANLKLTKPGRQLAKATKNQYLHTGGWPHDNESPCVNIGPMGTNARVQKDRFLFDGLQRILRTILAVEMEGAALGNAAESAGINHLVAKAVVDFADLDKNDNFRTYACEVSAHFLLSCILKSDAYLHLYSRD